MDEIVGNTNSYSSHLKVSAMTLQIGLAFPSVPLPWIIESVCSTSYKSGLECTCNAEPKRKKYIQKAIAQRYNT